MNLIKSTTVHFTQGELEDALIEAVKKKYPDLQKHGMVSMNFVYNILSHWDAEITFREYQ